MRGLLKRRMILIASLLLMSASGAWAQYISEVKVIGHKNEGTITALRDSYRNQGWTIVDWDLNDGAGGSYIFLMYKTGGYNVITGFYLRVSGKNDSPDELEYDNRTYYRADYDGSDGFKTAKGDLNNEAGGDFIHLYYTRDPIPSGSAVYRVYFDGNADGAVGAGLSLNKGTGGKSVYMHALTSTSPSRPVSYIQRIWDSGTAKVQEESKDCRDYTWLDGNASGINTKLGDGWYVVDRNVSYNKNIQVVGNVNIILVDGCTLTAEGGISIQTDKNLAIFGQRDETGTLYTHASSGPGIGGTGDILAGHLIVQGGTIDAASGSNNNAGIGGGNGRGSGIQSVTIYGGTVTAQGGSSAAGIGKGQHNDHWEVVTIYGGKVKATGGHYGAGIGGGEDRGNGEVTIWGGEVEAYGGWNGAGIGGGEGGDQDRPVTINGGNVLAVGNADSAGLNGGAGIGGGDHGNGGTLTVNDGFVTAYGRRMAAGIGGGSNGTNGNITINGGEVHGESHWTPGRGAGIGGGYQANQGGEIILNGGIVQGYSLEGAGIGGGFKGHGGRIVITDGLVLAKSGDGAGIGGGSSMDGGGGGNGGNVTISGGVVLAFSQKKGAGIGGGNDGDGGTLTVTDGHVTASGGQFDSDYWRENLKPDYTGFIKKWRTKDYHTVAINYLAELIFSGDWGGAGIGGGDDGNGGDITVTGGMVFASASNASAVGHGDGGKKHGNLTFGEEIGVYKVYNLNVPVLSAFRVKTCQQEGGVKIAACSHFQYYYTINEGQGTHTKHCQYCSLSIVEEHTFDWGGKCVCGYALDGDQVNVMDAKDNSAVLSGADGKLAHVVLQWRKLWKDGCWNTVCLPFALSAEDIADDHCPLHGASIKTLSGATFQDGVLTLSFSDASSIEAGKPYLVKWDEGEDGDAVTDPFFPSVTIDNTLRAVSVDGVIFRGSFSPVSLTANDKTRLYLGADNKLYRPTSDLVINSCRGYFELDGIETDAVAVCVVDPGN